MQDEIFTIACADKDSTPVVSTAPVSDNNTMPELSIEIPSIPDPYSCSVPQAIHATSQYMPFYCESTPGNQYSQGLIIPVTVDKAQLEIRREHDVSQPNPKMSPDEHNLNKDDDSFMPTVEEPSNLDALIQECCDAPPTESLGVTSPGTLPKTNDTSKSTQEEKKKKNRTSYTQKQLYALERSFHENPYPDSSKIEILSMELGITEPKLKIWFQNKRARFRKRNNEQPQQKLMPQLARPPATPYGLMPPVYHPMLHASPYHIAQNMFQNQLPTFPHHTAAIQFGNFQGNSPFRPGMSTPSKNSSPSSSTSSPLSNRSSPEQSNTHSPENAGSINPFHQMMPQFPAFPYPYGMYQHFAY